MSMDAFSNDPIEEEIENGTEIEIEPDDDAPTREPVRAPKPPRRRRR